MNAPLISPFRPLAEREADLLDCWVGVTQATYRFLVLVREFDRRQGWAEWGSADCADWLNWKCGINRSTAAEKLRTARSLYDLPQIEEAFKRGDLSYSKVVRPDGRPVETRRSVSAETGFPAKAAACPDFESRRFR